MRGRNERRRSSSPPVQLLDPEALTIGFARRFATYKRATLLFHDAERLLRMLDDPRPPAPVRLRGQSAPRGRPGKELIQRDRPLSRDRERSAHRIVFVEDYDMNVARQLVQGSTSG